MVQLQDKFWKPFGMMGISYYPDGCSPGETSPVLAFCPSAEQTAPWIIDRLEHTYALRETLERTLVPRPIRLVQKGGEQALLFADPGGNFTARLVGQPWEFSEFLRVATGITAALGDCTAEV